MAIHDTDNAAAINEVGELLIRAASTLARLTDRQLAALESADGGRLERLIYGALAAAAMLSPDVRESMGRHGEALIPRLMSSVVMGKAMEMNDKDRPFALALDEGVLRKSL